MSSWRHILPAFLLFAGVSLLTSCDGAGPERAAELFAPESMGLPGPELVTLEELDAIDVDNDATVCVKIAGGTTEEFPEPEAAAAQLGDAVDALGLDEKAAKKLQKKLEKALKELGKGGKPEKVVKEYFKFGEEVLELTEKGELSPGAGADLLDGLRVAVGSLHASLDLGSQTAGFHDLMRRLADLLRDGALAPKDAKKLWKKVGDAAEHFVKESVKGKPEKAVEQATKKLEEFQKEVGKLVEKGLLDPEEGDQLANAAQDAEDAAGGEGEDDGPVDLDDVTLDDVVDFTENLFESCVCAEEDFIPANIAPVAIGSQCPIQLF